MIALAALAFSALGNPDPLSLDTARKLSPRELELRVLQAERGTTREVAVRDLSHDMYRANQRADFSVAFADAPKPTALRGLCGVQVRTAVFGRGYAPDAGEKAPSHLIELSERTRYAVDPAELGSPATGPGECLPAPVLGNPRYFEVSGIWGGAANPADMVRAVRVIAGLTRNGAGGPLPPVACSEDVFAALGGIWEPLCAYAAKSVAALRWEEVLSLNVQQCGDGKLCIDAYFQRPLAPRDASRIVELKVQAGGGDRSEIASISLLGITAID